MLTLLLIIFILVIVGLIILGFVKDDNDVWCGVIAGLVLSSFVVVGLLVTVLVGIHNINTDKRIDAKIQLYTEENARIELMVTDAVETYLEHEYNIYDSLQGENIQTLLVAYPEINSNELVQKQIEIFVENNNQIKKLREKKADLISWKFLVYFGG